jgi:hypothetical protein
MIPIRLFLLRHLTAERESCILLASSESLLSVVHTTADPGGAFTPRTWLPLSDLSFGATAEANHVFRST